jgi:hypothetical protein
MSLAGTVLFVFLVLLIGVLGAILLATVHQLLSEAEAERVRRSSPPPRA